MRLIRASHPEDPVLDLALTHALLREVAAGDAPGAVRVLVPGATLAFGRLDALAQGFPDAVAAARRHGFVPALRLGGGHAAAYDGGSVVVEVITPQPRIVDGIEDRFAALTDVLLAALDAAGVAARVGELAGEYCPGRYSIHAGGVKLAGTAQRAVRGAALTTAVVLAERGDGLRAVLTDVYAALGIGWDPSTAGAAGVAVEALEAAVLEVLAARFAAAPVDVAPPIRAVASRLRERHDPGLGYS